MFLWCLLMENKNSSSLLLECRDCMHIDVEYLSNSGWPKHFTAEEVDLGTNQEGRTPPSLIESRLTMRSRIGVSGTGLHHPSKGATELRIGDPKIVTQALQHQYTYSQGYGCLACHCHNVRLESWCQKQLVQQQQASSSSRRRRILQGPWFGKARDSSQSMSKKGVRTCLSLQSVSWECSGKMSQMTW